MVHTTTATAAAYLAAIVDGEGCVTNIHSKTRAILIFNTERSIIDSTIRCLETLDIHYHIHELNTPSYRARTARQGWTITIGRYVEMLKFQKLVPLQSAAKAQRLLQLLSAYKPVSPTKEELYKLYHAEGYTTVVLAKQFKVTPPTIQKWLRSAGVPIRTASEAAKKVHRLKRKS